MKPARLSWREFARGIARVDSYETKGPLQTRLAVYAGCLVPPLIFPAQIESRVRV